MNREHVLHQTVAESYRRIGKPQSVLLALSGGADSMALLHLLLALQKEHPFKLSCVHINHGLRNASLEEELFVRKHVESLHLSLDIHRVLVNRNGNLEAEAREARYLAIQESRTKLMAEVVALGHHAHDQAETLLMHLMRGAGLDGLAGMAEYRAPYWRPLLQVPQPQLLAYLKGRKLPYVMDESNLDNRFLRNDLRHNLLNSLEERSPGVVDRMAQTAHILKEETDFLRGLEDDWLLQHGKTSPPFVFLMKDAFVGLPLAFQRRLLRRLCLVQGIRLDFQQTNRLLLMVLENKPQTINLPDGGKGFLTRERLHILHDDVKLTKPIWLEPRIIQAGEGMGDGLTEQVVDGDCITGAAMRQADEQDVIIPFGMDGSQSLKKYLSARKVDAPFRPFWPVYARGHQVLWVPGCGVSSLAAVTTDTKSRVKLVFKGRLPHEIKKDGGKET